jgi:hypothetical protein
VLVMPIILLPREIISGLLHRIRSLTLELRLILIFLPLYPSRFGVVTSINFGQGGWAEIAFSPHHQSRLRPCNWTGTARLFHSRPVRKTGDSTKRGQSIRRTTSQRALQISKTFVQFASPSPSRSFSLCVNRPPTKIILPAPFLSNLRPEGAPPYR